MPRRTEQDDTDENEQIITIRKKKPAEGSRTSAEEMVVSAWEQTKRDRTRTTPRFRVGPDGVAETEGDDTDLWMARVCQLFQVVDEHAMATLLADGLKMTECSSSQADQMNRVMNLVTQVGTRAGLEVLLGLQVAAQHSIAMRATQMVQRQSWSADTYERLTRSAARAATATARCAAALERIRSSTPVEKPQEIPVEASPVNDPAIAGVIVGPGRGRRRA